MSKITLNNVGSLIDATTAATTINSNFNTIQTAMDNTLSRDGTAPNTMANNIDMNSNRVLNLPQPLVVTEPLRLQDLNSFIGGGTISSIPAGGTTNQVLAKTSNVDYAVNWVSESTEVLAGTNIAVTGTSPVTVSTIPSPTFTAPTVTTINKVAITAPATSATLTIPDGITLTGPTASGTVQTIGNNETITGVKTFGAAGNVGKLTVAGNTSGSTVINATAVASGTLTLPAATDTLVGKATTDVLTNKTFNSTGTGNVLQVSGVTVSSGQYPGETTTGSATAGNVGEYVESVIAAGSAVSLTTSSAKTITSITLSAGDWDISGNIQFNTAATTSVTVLETSLSAATNTRDTTSGKNNLLFMNATVPTSSTPAWSLPVGPWRLSVAGSTTYFLVALAVFSASTLTANGIIRARRVR